MKAKISPQAQAQLAMRKDEINEILNTETSAIDIMERLKEIKKQPSNLNQVTVEGWVCRNGYENLADSILHLYLKGEPFPYYRPDRLGSSVQMWKGANGLHLPPDIFPSVTWESEPLKVKITITPIEE